MTEGVKTIMYPVTDLAKAVYGKLVGVEPYMDEAYYVGFNVGGQDAGLDPHGHSKGMKVPVCHRRVDDVEKSLKAPLEPARRRTKRSGCRRGQAHRLREGRRRQRNRPPAVLPEATNHRSGGSPMLSLGHCFRILAPSCASRQNAVRVRYG
jgi:hypothetical protein